MRIVYILWKLLPIFLLYQRLHKYFQWYNVIRILDVESWYNDLSVLQNAVHSIIFDVFAFIVPFINISIYPLLLRFRFHLISFYILFELLSTSRISLLRPLFVSFFSNSSQKRTYRSWCCCNKPEGFRRVFLVKIIRVSVFVVSHKQLDIATKATLEI